MLDYTTYYAIIEKPFFAPPAWMFGVAWSIIYPLIAIALLYLIWRAIRRETPWHLVWIFALNLVFNIAFTPLQLGFPGAIWATLDIVAVLVTLVVLLWKMWPHTKFGVVLLVPYLLWGAYATTLQVTIYFMNAV